MSGNETKVARPDDDTMKAPLRLLHLEDSADEAELIRLLLAMEWPDCQVVRVDNEADFTAGLKQGRFDLILSDYRLPCFDGLSALSLARKLSPEIPFVFLSGAIGDDDDDPRPPPPVGFGFVTYART